MHFSVYLDFLTLRDEGTTLLQNIRNYVTTHGHMPEDFNP